jgi:Fic family protein
MDDIIDEALQLFAETLRSGPNTPAGRLQHSMKHLVARKFSRKDYLALFPRISPSTASRDLKRGVDSGVLQKIGRRALTRYRYIPGD